MMTHLSCTRCDRDHDADRLQSLCGCGGPLFARYDLDTVRRLRPRPAPADRSDIWRWWDVMPIADGEDPLTLGEGGTPLTRSRRIGPDLGVRHLGFKDEGLNPTGSFKARGLAVAVHRARALGATAVALPSAGNAGSAAAAYAAAAGLSCVVAMPESTPVPIISECQSFGARVELVPGSIGDAGAWLRAENRDRWFDVSTLREPYRIEGKKTMGYELAEQSSWDLPDAIIYPTGGGTGLIAMWKAFGEMEALGWIGAGRPRMIVVQAEGCAPIVHAFEAGRKTADAVADPTTVASGLCVPSAIGDALILDAIYASGGTAVAVSDEALLRGARMLATMEGIHAGPEAGATVAALERLIAEGRIDRDIRVVCFITGHGLKYPVIMEAAECG